MDTDDVLAIIGRELNNAVGQDGDELSSERLRALDYYRGICDDLTNRPGHSTVISRNVLEAVEWIIPALIRIFCASDKIATIEPTKPGDAQEQAAEDATSYITQIFYRDNDGFSLLNDFFKDALISKIGWIKRIWNTNIVQETESYSGLTPDEYSAKYAELQQRGEVEVLETEERADPITQQPLHDCTLMVTMEKSRVLLENIPPEEIVFSPKCRRGYMPFISHRRPRTVSDLIAEGYDEDSVRDCVGLGQTLEFQEALSRQQPQTQNLFDNPADESMQVVWCEENYLLMDWNQDGIAELCKVTTVSHATRVLLEKGGEPDIEPVDEIPFVWVSPVPMPHTLSGSMSVAELVMDLQRIKSTLLRQMLDNLYLTNNPRFVMGEAAASENTQNDILRSQPGGIIRARDPTGIVPLVTPFVAGAAFPMLEYIDNSQQMRTGISPQNSGIDPNSLNKYATATSTALMQQAASQRVELIARIFGQGVKDLVRGILGLVRRHQQQARVIMVTGKPLTLDPKLWKEELDVSVNVGLGTGSRDQVLGYLMQVIGLQSQIVQQQQGLNGPLVTAKNVYDALDMLTEQAGFRQSFFTDPAQAPPQPPQQPPPDPTMAVAQAQIAVDAKKAEAQMALNQQKAAAQNQLQDKKIQQDAALNTQETQQETQLKREEMQARLQLEQLQAQHQFDLEKMKLQNELIISRERETARAALAERELSQRMDLETQRLAQPPEPGGFPS
jgi:hypothetical protein